jgi:hypothetical protein
MNRERQRKQKKFGQHLVFDRPTNGGRIMPQDHEGEWIAHDGRPMPIDWKTKVEVRFRDGDKEHNVLAGFWAAGYDWWQHQANNHSCDIVAYRIIP